MLDDWLEGVVPAAVMADWCEEQGLVFPRSQTVTHRKHSALWETSVSNGYTYSESLGPAEQRFHHGRPRCSGSRTGRHRNSWSGSRSGSR